ncbi:hypothetical protein HC752_01290 [Vibrio sp. S9_S30]|uniref:hypothetical protein n=1 Tax=Vibrio sp. S9_S30 TaxID=2720226 RepID=UPI001680AE77|nr:hypothetical protein [Vibrio sp. S9_S30]MBD1555568.1 hypothetical protein [Vibrio sp. S9_S30]
MKKLLISLVLTCISMASSATIHQAEDTSTVNLERASAFAHTMKQNEMFSQPSLALVKSNSKLLCETKCQGSYGVCIARTGGSATCVAQLATCQARCA